MLRSILLILLSQLQEKIVHILCEEMKRIGLTRKYFSFEAMFNL